MHKSLQSGMDAAIETSGNASQVSFTKMEAGLSDIDHERPRLFGCMRACRVGKLERTDRGVGCLEAGECRSRQCVHTAGGFTQSKRKCANILDLRNVSGVRLGGVGMGFPGPVLCESTSSGQCRQQASR